MVIFLQQLVKLLKKFMINIFFNPSYARGKKVFISKQFKHTKLSSVLNDFMFNKGLPYPNQFITSGPQKRINNAVRTFRADNRFVFNELKFDCTYFITLDDKSLKIFENLVRNQNESTKIIVGPLFPQENEIILNSYINKYKNIRKLVSSDIAMKNALYEMNHDVDKNRIIMVPSGVVSVNKLKKNILNKQNPGSVLNCLVYFKKRERAELESVLRFLNSNKINYKVFEYGKYDNIKMKKEALKSDFCIFMSRPETQGFAAQEIMSCNLPMLVWDKTDNFYGNKKLSGTTVTIFDKRCGEIVYDFTELEKRFNNFINNLKSFEPGKLVEEQLTYKIFKKRIFEEFNKI